MFFQPALTSEYFMRSTDVAVRVNGEWRFFDPGRTYISFGMLSWDEEAFRRW